MFIAKYNSYESKKITSRYNSNRNPYGIWTNKGKSISSIKMANDDGEVNEYWLPTSFVRNLKRIFLGHCDTTKPDLTIDGLEYVEARLEKFVTMPAISSDTIAYKESFGTGFWYRISPKGEKYQVTKMIENFSNDGYGGGFYYLETMKVSLLTRKQLERMRPTLIQVTKSPRTELQQSLIDIFGTIESGMNRSEVIEFCKNSDEFRSTMIDNYSVNEIIEAIQTM